MNGQSTLFWSHVNKYETCPQYFLWDYGWDGIDLGRGPGRGKLKPPVGSRHHAVMGMVIESVLGQMYNEALWKEPKSLHKKLQSLVEPYWAKLESKKRNPINYEEAGMSRAEMMEICKEGVLGYLHTMKAHKLLGSYAQAEVEMVGWANRWTSIGGRADFIINREDTGVTILDGKNTKKKMSGVNPDQLRWYALLFALNYKIMPSRLGFVWYRFPHGHLHDDPTSQEQTPEVGLEWVPYTKDDLRGLAARAIDARDSMIEEKFTATPSPSICRNCDFLSVCPERQAQRLANGEKRSLGSKIQDILPGEISDLSLD